MTLPEEQAAEFERLVERGRTLVVDAFRIPEKSPPTPMAAYRGKGRNQAPAHVRERKLPDRDATRVRRIQAVGLNPVRVYATESVQPKYSQPLQVAIGGAVIRAIRELEPIAQDWMNCRYRAYGPELPELKDRLQSKFTRAYMEGRDAMRTSTRDLVALLIATQVRHCEYGGRWDNWGKGAPIEVRNALGVTGKAWSKTYAPHWAEIRRCLLKIDSLALAEVALKLDGRTV